MKTLTGVLFIAAALLLGCTHQSKSETKHVNLSADEELKVLHLVQANNEARQRFEAISQKYSQQAEADPEFRAAREKAQSSSDTYQSISRKYSAAAEKDVEFQSAKAKAEKNASVLQDEVNRLLEAKKCKDCRVEKNPDYSFYLTNEPKAKP
jgi:chromosome segregation ATPase